MDKLEQLLAFMCTCQSQLSGDETPTNETPISEFQFCPVVTLSFEQSMVVCRPLSEREYKTILAEDGDDIDQLKLIDIDSNGCEYIEDYVSRSITNHAFMIQPSPIVVNNNLPYTSTTRVFDNGSQVDSFVQEHNGLVIRNVKRNKISGKVRVCYYVDEQDQPWMLTTKID